MMPESAHGHRAQVAAGMLAIMLASCMPAGAQTGQGARAEPRFPSPEPSSSAAEPGVVPPALSLDEAIGAVMMVGFQGQLSDTIVQDWSRHHFGGLLVVNLNHNGATSPAIGSTIARLRSTGSRRLLAATDQEGAGICLALADIPCAAGPAGRDESTRMAAALHGLGFDVDLGPVADVCSVPGSIMATRCYGSDPAAVSAAVGEVVDGIHAGHMLAVAKHFPGHGGTTVSSESRLPLLPVGVATLRERDWPPFRAAAAHGTDMVLLGHLHVPALDNAHASSLSPATIGRLREEVGFRGAIISDDLEMGAITATTPTPEAAVEFLVAGGDMVMVAHHIEVADATFEAIRAAVTSGRLPRSRLDQAVASLAALPDR